MSVDRSAANQKMIREAEETQAKTKEAVLRIQQQTAATQELGAATLEELRAQGRQMDDINADIQAVNAKLDTAAGLQDRFDAWSGNIFGFKKRAATKEAESEIAAKVREDMLNVKEVFENEKYDMLSGKWKPHGMTLCSNPTTKAPDLFDPSSQVTSTGNSKWDIDFTLAGIDHEGWTYAGDFAYLNKHGAGSAEAAWNSYARRRKWKYSEKTGNEVIDGVRARNKERVSQRQAAAAANQSQTDKIGYVPRSNISTMKASGLTSTNRNNRGKEELDEESKAGLSRINQNDAEIDQGINEISRGLDSLADIANKMKEETQSHNKKLEAMDANMQQATDKQTVINARQRRFLS
mmetsp:Transcript_16185/g.16925  ORF Transcript_16185/g.16925 Transcript_16185/m.16925 type:complete len:351 (-) Transcript_16185:297-1349(-)|eukprot:CAMPEP_0174824430 /NCGR_PEP_ID=MMETSP1107-20130205/34193_1 /TAXON_ID=36770 /ORGANISM="Paraphysomonas vestita, Strain GFlagA" /LENGTH=350 /DNA_ID=CAMNT_0016051711 /DNA_START=95 /DNA_END=1147 /DNA_ORIENTATION=+